MASSSIFQLPDELVFSALSQSLPCREPQIKALITLLYPDAAPCRNVVVHGTESTGKSVVTEAVLERMVEDAAELKYAVINSLECITARHLFETTATKVANALDLGSGDVARRCENLSQLVVELSKLLADQGPLNQMGSVERAPGWRRFVLVFDTIDRQRDAPPTLLPALARLSEIIPNLTTVFIMTYPPAGALKMSAVPHIHFPNYTKDEFVQILASTPPPPLPTTTPEETSELWSRFIGPVHDALAKAAARTLPTLRHAVRTLWPRFTAPILAGTHSPREFTKLLVAARIHLQDESVLDQGIIAVRLPATDTNISGANSELASKPSAPMTTSSTTATNTTTTTSFSWSTTLTRRTFPATNDNKTKTPDLSALLPTSARLLLLAAYLASHNATKHDLTLFSTHYHGRRRRRGGLLGGSGRGRGRSKHRKISRKLLGAHAFVFERMMAIYVAVRGEWMGTSSGNVGGSDKFSARENDDDGNGLDCDVSMAMATLSSLRLLVRVGGGAGGGDPTDRGGKWRVNVGWEVIRALGRGMGVEVEEWLID